MHVDLTSDAEAMLLLCSQARNAQAIHSRNRFAIYSA